MLKLFRWKGIRIRKRHKGALIRFFIYLMIPILIITGYLEYTMINQEQQAIEMLVGIAVSGLLLASIMSYLLIYFPFYNLL